MQFSIRLLSVIILGWVMVAPLASSSADEPAKPEPPVRLKKKKRADPVDEPAPDKDKKAEEKKPEEPGIGDRKPEEPRVGDKKKDRGDNPKLKREDDEPEPAESEDSREIVARVSKNMRAAEDRLAKKDPGNATRGLQKDILKDLDRLIEENQRQQQQQQQQGGGGSATQRRLQEEQQKNGKSGQKQKQSGREGGKKKGPKKEGAGKGKNGGKDKEGMGKEGKNGQGGDSKDKKDSSRVADVYKDIWGHLPEKMRQEMDAYSREQFMERYKGLLKQYYSTLSEKGRGKNE